MVVSIQSIEKSSHSVKQSESELQQSKIARAYDRLELITLLQSTLDLDLLLRYFTDNLNAVLKVDGICYHEDERSIRIKQGKQTAHSCGYRLINGDENYGELEFKRSKRFSEAELQQIEELVILLLIPISNALKYMDALRQAFQIPLFSIGDRASLEQNLIREIELAKRHNHPLSLVVFSFDSATHKKTTKLPANIVSGIVASIQSVCRGTDMLYRSGGKEFRLIVHNNGGEAVTLVKRLEKAIDKKFRDDEGYGLLTRIACSTLTGTDSAKSLIERARNQLN